MKSTIYLPRHAFFLKSGEFKAGVIYIFIDRWPGFVKKFNSKLIRHGESLNRECLLPYQMLFYV